LGLAQDLADLAQQRLNTQLASLASLQNKGLGLIAVNGALGGTFVLTGQTSPIGPVGVWVLWGLVISLICAFLSITDPPLTLGPSATELYDEFISGKYDGPQVKAALIRGLEAAYAANLDAIRPKFIYWTVGSVFTIASFVLFTGAFVVQKGWLHP
jgi:hypothetical protein